MAKTRPAGVLPEQGAQHVQHGLHGPGFHLQGGKDGPQDDDIEDEGNGIETLQPGRQPRNGIRLAAGQQGNDAGAEEGRRHAAANQRYLFTYGDQYQEQDWQ
jgi:hypothetical protein